MNHYDAIWIETHTLHVVGSPPYEGVWYIRTCYYVLNGVEMQTHTLYVVGHSTEEFGILVFANMS